MNIEPGDLIVPLIGLWCAFVYLTVPEAPNPYAKGSRWWLSYKLFGGTRGVRMFMGFMVISVFAGILVAK